MSTPPSGSPPVPRIEYRAAPAELTNAQIIAEIVWLTPDLCWCDWARSRATELRGELVRRGWAR